VGGFFQRAKNSLKSSPRIIKTAQVSKKKKKQKKLISFLAFLNPCVIMSKYSFERMAGVASLR
jgi:hypothetical protein